MQQTCPLTTAAPSINIDRVGHHIALVDQTVPRKLSRALRTSRIVSGADTGHGYDTRRELDSLLSPRDQVWRANAGLLDVIAHFAGTNSHQLNVRASAPIARLAEPAADPRIVDDRPAEFVANHARGVIRIGAQVDPADIIAQIGPAFPQARIAVLGSHRAQLEKIRQKIQQSLPDRQFVSRVPEDENGSWVAVSTFTAAAVGRLEKSHLVLLVDASHAAHQLAEPALATMDARFRLIGLLHAGRHLPPGLQDSLMANFGAAVLDVPRLGRELARVQTVRVDINTPRVEEDLAGVALHRAGCWNHPVRNRMISQLATALRSGDGERLRRFHGVQAWMVERAQRSLRVTILVHNLDHALALARQLAGWPVVCQPPGQAHPPRCANNRDQRLLAERTCFWLTGEQQIVTCDAADRDVLAGSDVIIYAGGGPQALAMPRHRFTCPARSGRRLLLIDFTDRHHPDMAAWSRNRYREYEARDWFGVGVDLHTGRIERFLQQSPRKTTLRRRRST